MDFSNWFSSGRLDENNEFLKEFKAATGRTPTDYINYQRTETSKLILSKPNLKEDPISRIAHEVGYRDPMEFITRVYHFILY